MIEFFSKFNVYLLDIFDCQIAVWWEREHDIALLDGVLKHGLRAINHVIEDEQLPFMQHADVR